MNMNIQISVRTEEEGSLQIIGSNKSDTGQHYTKNWLRDDGSHSSVVELGPSCPELILADRRSCDDAATYR